MSSGSPYRYMYMYLICLIILSAILNCCVGKDVHKLLLISLDGFRWDYLNRNYYTPNIDSLIKYGTRIKSLRNAYVTKTFPNHFTIVTGQYEESHGIVANDMFDPKFNETFWLGSKRSHSIDIQKKWFDNGHIEPIWLTNQKEKQHYSGSVMWPTSWAWSDKIKALDFNSSISFKSRIDTTVTWLSDESNFVSLYYEEPDETGHQFGPDSEEIKNKVQELDYDIGYLIASLKKSQLFDRVNIILTSDHGMANTNKGIIEMNDYVDPSSYLGIPAGTAMMVFPNSDKEKKIIYKNLTAAHIRHVKFWKKRDIPKEYHYQHHRRIPPILLEAQEGWVIVKGQNYTTKGNHGYNNSLPDMHPIFIAHGPSFKRGLFIDDPAIENVDIYPLMCHLLGVKAAPNNGSFVRIKKILKRNIVPFINDNSLLIAAILVSVILVALVLGVLVSCAKKAIRSRYEFVGWDDQINAQDSDVQPLHTGSREKYTHFLNESENSSL